MFDTTHFPKAKKFWYKGKFYDWSDAHVHPMSHALHYGSSVFEGIRAYKTEKGPAIFRLAEHIDRFFYSASVMKMKVPYSKEEIIQAIKATIRENELESAYIRPVLFYSYGNLGLVPKFCPVELAIGTWEWGAYLGERAMEGVSVYIHPQRRIHHSQMDTTAKVGGLYVQSTICGFEARLLGYDEAIFLNLEGNVAEGPGENIFIYKNGTLITNNKTESILEGITRLSLLEIAKDIGLKTEIEPIPKEDFLSADEVLFCGTAVEVTPIVRIVDGSNPEGEKKEYLVNQGKPGEVTLKLAQIYGDAVRGKFKKYEKWLTYVYS